MRIFRLAARALRRRRPVSSTLGITKCAQSLSPSSSQLQNSRWLSHCTLPPWLRFAPLPLQAPNQLLLNHRALPQRIQP